MAAFTLVWTETFERTARKFLRRHPELAGIFEDVLQQLETDLQIHLRPCNSIIGNQDYGRV
jgi:hypothetical protein